MPKPSIQNIARAAEQLREERDETLTRQRVTEIETEMKERRFARQEELRQRRQQPEPTQEELAAQQAQEQPLQEPAGKQQIKTAQTRAQPETVGRRIGG